MGLAEAGAARAGTWLGGMAGESARVRGRGRGGPHRPGPEGASGDWLGWAGRGRQGGVAG